MMTGQTKKGKQLFKEHHKKALTPQVVTETINYPDGRSAVKTSKPYINQYYVDGIERLAKHYSAEL